jgi:hypothetical protein
MVLGQNYFYLVIKEKQMRSRSHLMLTKKPNLFMNTMSV